MKVTPEEIREQVADARNRGAILTNFFPNPARLDEWCAAKCLTLVTQGETLFLLRDQGIFVTLYFVTPSAKALGADVAAILATLPGRRVIVDVVGADAMRLPLHHALEDAGFKAIGELQRMGRKTPQEVYQPSEAVHIASDSEVVQVLNLLQRYFNQEVDQLPSLQELISLRENQSILVETNAKGEVLGFVIFELTPASFYWRYWLVLPSVRGIGVGRNLSRTAFAKAATSKRQYLWVLTNNETAVTRHLHYGFAFEPMKDVVLARDVPPTKESDHA